MKVIDEVVEPTTTVAQSDWVVLWVSDTPPTDSLDSGWRTFSLTKKENALREITLQPFF